MARFPACQKEAKLLSIFFPEQIQVFQVDEERLHPVSYRAVISITEIPLAWDMRGKGHYTSFHKNDTPHYRHPEIINTLRTKTCLPINLHMYLHT